MPNSENHEFLSFGDALFLYLEREEAPLNIASVGVFEGTIELEDLICFVESKLPQIPRYMQRVAIPPLNVGSPSWEFDPFFKIENHVRQLNVKRGTEAELKEVAGNILSTTLDRRRPLWDLTLVGGLKGRKTGLISRVHHCMADGLSGVSLLNALMDASPVVPRLRRKRKTAEVPPPRDPVTLFADGLLQSYFSMVQRTLMAYSDMLKMAQRAIDTVEAPGTAGPSQPPAGVMNGGLDSLSRLIPELIQPIERLPFNVLCRGPQKFRWERIPLPAIKAIKSACDTTVNDVVLTMLAAAFREYVKLHGTNVAGRSLRIVVPVSVRDSGSGDMGNHITFVPVSAPLDVEDPRKLLAAVHERMEMLKTTGAPELAVFSGILLGMIPSPVQAVVAPILSRLPISLCNVICTNVPGPKEPLYLIGHKMLSCYPYVPIGGEMGINCAVLTYDNNAYFGFTGDANAAPDLARLEAFLVQGFKELQAASVHLRRSGRAKPKRKRARKASARRSSSPVKRERVPEQKLSENAPDERTAVENEAELEAAIA